MKKILVTMHCEHVFDVSDADYKALTNGELSIWDWMNDPKDGCFRWDDLQDDFTELDCEGYDG